MSSDINRNFNLINEVQYSYSCYIDIKYFIWKLKYLVGNWKDERAWDISAKIL